jgi:hypothetical protein
MSMAPSFWCGRLALMLWSTSALIVCCIVGFMANHIGVFSVPISLLIYCRQGWLYYVIIAAFITCLAIYDIELFRRGSTREGRAVAVLGMLFMALLGLNNNIQPAHNLLAFTAMGLSTVYSLFVASRNSDPILIVMGSASLCMFSEIFSNEMDLVGRAEGVIMAICLLIANTDYYHRFNAITLPRWTFRVTKLLDSRRKLAGMYWSISCFLICGSAGFMRPSLIGGPLLLGVTWIGGYVAWHDDLPFRYKSVPLIGSVAASLFLLASLGDLNHELSTSIPAAMGLIFVYVLALFYDSCVAAIL